MAIKLCRMVTYEKGSWLLSHVVLRDHVTNLKRLTCTTTMPMVTKHGAVVIYHERLPSVGHMTL